MTELSSDSMTATTSDGPSVIDALPTHDTPRPVTRVIGERSALGITDPTDRDDMIVTRLIDRDLPNIFDQTESDSELIQEVKDRHPGDVDEEGVWRFAVIGSEGVPVHEVGRMQGWVGVYRGEETEDLQAAGLLEKDFSSDVLEISYARRPDAPDKQMASAVRQVCLKLSQMNGAMAENDPNKLKPDFAVTAFVTTDNEKSQRVLEAAGFEKKGMMAREGEEDVGEQICYRLDWDNLHKISQDKAA